MLTTRHPETGRMTTHLSLPISGSEASSLLVRHGPQWTAEPIYVPLALNS